MKCLSVKQPYADLIVKGLKTVELRSWNTNYRGELLIHASSEPDKEGMRRFNMDESAVAKGAIVGKVLLYGVKQYNNIRELMLDKNMHLAGEEYINKAKFGFMLREAKLLSAPMPSKGSLGIYEVNEMKLGEISYA
ncbi:MAG TPA: ASCH domain-containing protein [Candidatus Acidoferrales bacterium]|nr:ASCH domain-containing protein [Candidatus Acidoferrales bacterium]